MADTIEITCPSCKTNSRAPAEIAGKKIRCKQCQTVFVAQAKARNAAPSAAKGGAKASPKAAANKPVAKKPPAEEEDEYTAAKNPYAVTTENLAARCPFCALPLDPPDSRICLHCGYDMQKRQRVESKQTYEITGMDYFIYHLPTIICFIIFGIVVAVDVISIMYCHPLLEGSWFENEDHTFLIKPEIVPVYVILLTGIFIATPCVIVMFKRLSKFTPPEKTVHARDD